MIASIKDFGLTLNSKPKSSNKSASSDGPEILNLWYQGNLANYIKGFSSLKSYFLNLVTL